jgi:hypothetical protein
VIIDEQIISPGSGPADKRALSGFPAMRTLRIVLTMTPRGGAVLTLDGELLEATDAQEMAALLADTCFKRSDIQLDGLPITKWLLAALQWNGVQVDNLDFGNDVHQCIFPANSLQQDFESQEESRDFTK